MYAHTKRCKSYVKGRFGKEAEENRKREQGFRKFKCRNKLC